MTNFAKGATVNITNLAHIANMNGKSGLNNGIAIPREIVSSMDMQGMTGNKPFSPGQPINPNNPIGSQARQFEYVIGQNIVQRPRSTENISFDTIRQIVEMYDIAQMCIEVRQDELRNLDWDIVPKDEDDKNASEKYSSQIKQVKAFFEKPDGDMLFDDFQNQLAYDWLVYDALAIAPEFNKGGKLIALHPVDGTTFTPLVDYYGRKPKAPAPAYVQFINGLPWVWQDSDHLIYNPHRRRTNKLYGYSPVEWLLNTINTDIRYQLYFLQYFTDGSIPDTWVNMPDGVTQANQIKEFQEYYDSVMIGDQTQKHRAKFIPFGSKVTQAKDSKFDIEFPRFMLEKTCAAYKVAPSEIGFTEKVNKSSGETQENMQYRRSIKPSAKFFSSIYTGIIEKYFGLPNLKFKFLNVEEQEDMLLMAQRDQIYVNIGSLSPDEVRSQRLGLEVDSNNPIPRLFVAGTTVMPVSDIVAQSQANLALTQKTRNNTELEENSIDDVNANNKESKNNIESEKADKDFFISPVGKRKSN